MPDKSEVEQTITSKDLVIKLRNSLQRISQICVQKCISDLGKGSRILHCRVCRHTQCVCVYYIHSLSVTQYLHFGLGFGFFKTKKMLIWSLPRQNGFSLFFVSVFSLLCSFSEKWTVNKTSRVLILRNPK